MRRSCVFVAALVSLLCLVAGGSEEGTKEPATESKPALAEKLENAIAEILKVTGNGKVRVGTFIDFDMPNSNSGSAIEEVLKGELKRRLPEGSLVVNNPDFTITGQILYSKRQEKPPITLKFRIQDRDGEELSFDFGPLQVDYNDPTVVGLFTQPTVELKATEQLAKARPAELAREVAALPPQPELDKAIVSEQRAALENPSFYVEGTRVSAAKDSPYSVEVWAGRRGSPLQVRPVTDRDGMAYVDLTQGEIYQIRLYNRSENDVAASVSIDGVSTYHFSEDRDSQGYPLYNFDIVYPAGTTVPNPAGGPPWVYHFTRVAGWQKSLSMQTVWEFEVTGPGQGVAQGVDLSTRGKTGVIHVQFRAAYETSQPVGLAKRGLSGSETRKGDVRGAAQMVVKREIGPLLSSVSIRYSRD